MSDFSIEETEETVDPTDESVVEGMPSDVPEVIGDPNSPDEEVDQTPSPDSDLEAEEDEEDLEEVE